MEVPEHCTKEKSTHGSKFSPRLLRSTRILAIAPSSLGTYVTCYYPPQLDDRTGDMDPELFHIEFDDGDEMDMNSAELHHAIQLAQERGYASAAEDGEEGDGAMGIA